MASRKGESATSGRHEGFRSESPHLGGWANVKEDAMSVGTRAPMEPDEVRARFARVVFPTGLDRRADLGEPDRIDVYYGMADSRIGAARLDLHA